MTESRRSYCGLCHPRCGLLLEIEGGRIDRRMVDADHGWWFPERREAEPELFGVFESNANVLCPDGAEFCSPEIGSWPHTVLLCRVRKEQE